MGTVVVSGLCHSESQDQAIMVTLTCILEFSDGTRTTASVAAVTPEGSYPVEYRGAVHRLPRQLDASDPRRLETFFHDLALETGGRLQVFRKGVYDFCGR